MKSKALLLSLALFPAIIFAQDKIAVAPPPPPPVPPANLVTPSALPANPTKLVSPVKPEVEEFPAQPPPPPAISVTPPALSEKPVVPYQPASPPPVIRK